MKNRTGRYGALHFPVKCGIEKRRIDKMSIYGRIARVSRNISEDSVARAVLINIPVGLKKVLLDHFVVFPQPRMAIFYLHRWNRFVIDLRIDLD